MYWVDVCVQHATYGQNHAKKSIVDLEETALTQSRTEILITYRRTYLIIAARMRCINRFSSMLITDIWCENYMRLKQAVCYESIYALK